jgi:hypothetical protein
MNGASDDVSFQDFKKFSPDERDFFIFNQLQKLDTLDGLDDRFSGKWVEKGVRVAIYGILASIGGAILWMIGIHKPPIA